MDLRTSNTDNPETNTLKNWKAWKFENRISELLKFRKAEFQQS
jgi:hypothetical protein